MQINRQELVTVRDRNPALALPSDLLLFLLYLLANPVYVGRLAQVNKTLKSNVESLSPVGLNLFWKVAFFRDFNITEFVPTQYKDLIEKKDEWKMVYKEKAKNIKDNRPDCVRNLHYLIKSGDTQTILNQYVNPDYFFYEFNGYDAIELARKFERHDVLKHMNRTATDQFFTKKQSSFTLIKFFQSDKPMVDPRGMTQAHWAVACGLLDEAEKWLEGINFSESKTNQGETCLHIACRYNDLAIAKMLIEKGHPIDLVDKCGLTPLLTAAYYSDKDILDLLLDNGADVNHLSRSRGSALNITIGLNKQKCFESLVEHSKIRVNQTSSLLGQKYYQQPIMFAAQFGLSTIVKRLIEKKANIYSAHSTSGGEYRTALSLAVNNQHLDIAKYLLDAGAPINQLELAYNGDKSYNYRCGEFLQLWELKEQIKHLPINQQILKILKLDIVKTSSASFISTVSAIFSSPQKAFIKPTAIIGDVSFEKDSEAEQLRSLLDANKQYISPDKFNFIMHCILDSESLNQRKEPQTHSEITKTSGQ